MISFDEKVDFVSCYVNFCEDLVSEHKTVKCYPNNKPWVTKELKELINEKKIAFLNKNDKSVIKDIDKKLKSKTNECQKKFKEKLEKSFKNNNTRHAWQGMNTIIGRQQNRRHTYHTQNKTKHHMSTS